MQKRSVVYLSKNAEKDINRIPKAIEIQFEQWVAIIKFEGYEEMQKIRGYRDHSLKGNRQGQRSSSLSRSYRVIYIHEDDQTLTIITVLEVNKHEY